MVRKFNLKVLYYLWQLPQHLLALILIYIYKPRIRESYRHKTVYRLWGSGWGISLGNYIILDTRHTELTVKHEYGHSLQSLMLGPLYLILVGIPSITMNILSTILFKLGKPKMLQNYYKRWPESWADKLGEVGVRP